jgi:predicted AAA+ superfamily ATPase
MDLPLFLGLNLSDALTLDVRRMNPWWEGHALPVLPATRRHLVDRLERHLEQRLAPVVVVRGPRQVGKTTALLQLIAGLLARGTPPRHIFRLQVDALPSLAGLEEPLLRLVDWYERALLGRSLNDVASEGGRTYLFLDEIQGFADWAPQLKFLVDHATTQVVVAGSSALSIELGHESLAGRVSTIEAGVLSLQEIARFRGLALGGPFFDEAGLEPLGREEFWRELREHGRRHASARDAAFAAFSERGGFPLVHQRSDVAWPQLADQLAETVVRHVLQHDLRSGEEGRRDPRLLEEMFRLSCRYVGQSPGADLLAREAHRALGANLGSHRARQYLRFLAEALLVRLVPAFELRLKRTRGSDKICLADHGLRASWLQESVPLDPAALLAAPQWTATAGRLAESIAGATLASIAQLEVAHLPARTGEPGVEFVLTVGTRRIPLAVRYQRHLDPLVDTEGLRTFLERTANQASFGLLVSQTDAETVPDPRIITLPLSTLLLLR